MKKFKKTIRKARKAAVSFFILMLVVSMLSPLPFDVKTAKAATLTIVLNNTQTILTEGTTWTVPAGWTSANNTIEVIGGGGSGFTDTTGIAGAGGGGGGAYSKITNLTLTPGASVTYQIGIGGKNAALNGGDTFFNRTAGAAGTCADTTSVCAKGGTGATGPTGAAGGALASGTGATKYSGGAGGTGSTTSDAAGGGGGAGGPNVDGKTGGNSGSAAAGDGGGGGGGNGGSSSAVGAVGTATGGAGGAGNLGTGGGTGGSAANGGNGTTSGAGGGGGDSGFNGGNGFAGANLGGGVGPGGGGGGAGDTTTVVGQGGHGGLYGAGGGGGRYGGKGAPGIIVITYNGLTPTRSTWTVPSDWDNAANTIEVFGAGGSAFSAAQGAGTGGGGGGAYSKITNLTLTPGGSVTYQIGQGGRKTSVGFGAGVNGGDTFFNRTAGTAGTCADTTSVCAKGGVGATSITGAAGGAAASGTGATKWSGGAGATGHATGDSGGGGGGAGGATQDGKAGGLGYTAASGGGGGGGGAGDDSGTNSTVGGAGVSANGGAGGMGPLGTGSGAAGANGSGGNATAGTGAGGGGGDAASVAGPFNGGNGAYGNSAFYGGGGGGGTGDNNLVVTGALFGGEGGYFGGGGGAGLVQGFGGNGGIVITYTQAGAATTTLATGTNPGNSTIAPGGAITSVNGFTLTTSTGTDPITSITVNLSTNSGVGTLTITDSVDAVLGSIGGGTGAGIVTGSNAISISSTNATTGGTAFKVKVTPLSHANMAAPDGGAYAITGAVTDWAGTNAKAGQASDTSSTVTIDNDSPGVVTSTSGSAGDGQVTINYTTPADTDIASGQVVILKKTGSTISDTPTEGQSYAVNDPAGASSVGCIDTTVAASTADSCIATGLTNNTAYYFKIFVKDNNGNYTLTGTAPTGEPFTPQATTTLADGTDPGNSTIAPGAAETTVGVFTLDTSSGTEAVTSVTVNLSTANGVGTLKITDNADASLGSTGTPATGANAISVTGMTATTSAPIFKIRIIPLVHTSMPAPDGGAYAITATATSWVGTTNIHTGTDTDSATITIDNDSPGVVTSTSGTAGDGQVTVNYTTPADTDIASGQVVILRKTGSVISDTPTEGQAYSVNDPVGSSYVACIDTSVAASTADSCIATGLTNNTAYYFKIFVKDNNGNYTATGTAPASEPFTPNGIITLATGTDPGNSTIAPSAAATYSDAFTVTASSTTNNITAVVVGLGTGASAGISLVEIKNDANTITYGSVAPGSDTPSVTLGTNITATTSATQYRIYITPKTHAAMAAPAGASYSVTAKINSFTSTYTAAGSDTAGATITIDNASPNNATSTSGSAGDQKVTLAWTTSSSTDFSRSVVLRWAAATPGTEVPAEGTDYSVGNTITTATVACVRTTDGVSAAVSGQIDGSGGTANCNTTALTNGTQYSYKIFQKDSNGNYDVGVTVTSSPFTPKATITINVTAGSKFATRNSGDTSQYAHDTACTGAASCSAFTLSISSGSDTVTSIKITETGAAAADTDLSNLALFYDTDGNWADAGAETQYGSTVAAFSAGQTAEVTGSLAVSSANTYYFYVRYDVMRAGAPNVYPKGGQTVNFQIAADADVIVSGTSLKSGAPKTLAGTQTVLPNAASISYTVGTDGGRSSDSATISGYGFGAPTAGANREDCTTATVDRGCVKFTVGGTTNVANADITSWTNTSIEFTVSSSLASDGGAAAVEVRAANQADATKLDYFVYPKITSYTAALGNGDYQNQTISINGDHFGSSGTVSNISFNGTNPASMGTWASTNLSVVDIPDGGTDSGTITVTRGTKDSNASSTFYIYPQITSFTAAQGDGDIQSGTITISGNHFGTGGTTANVLINGVAPESLTWTSATSITAVAIPDSGGDSGNVTVTSPGTNKTSNNSSTFYIYPDVTGTIRCTKSTTPPWPLDAGREYAAGDSACPNNLKDGHVVLNGNHLGSAGSVTIHGVSATQETVSGGPCASAYSATCITVQIPAGIADSSYTGDIVATRTSGSKIDTYSGFRILPRVTSTGPVNLKGAQGDTGVSVNGDHLCQSGTCPPSFTEANKVNFTGASVISGSSVWTTNSIPSITIPEAASDGAANIVSNADYVSNDLTYDVKFKPNVSSGTGRTPTNSATGQSRNPVLNGTAFVDGTGDSDAHLITEWQIDQEGTFATSEWTRTSSSAETSTTVNNTNGSFAGLLTGETQLDCVAYSWRYRYKDNGTVSSAEWSDWSPTWTFTPTGCGPDATSPPTNNTDGGITNGGRGGHSITLTGEAFGAVAAGADRANCAGGAGTGCIRIGGTGGATVAYGDISAWTATSITFTLSVSIASYGGATTGGLIVYAAGVSDTDGLTFYVYPDITSLSVSEAREGDTITINGNHFGTGAGTNKVTIDENAVSDCTWSETALSNCTVPTAIADANDSVTVRAYQGTGGNNSLYDNSAGFGILPKITGIAAATYADGGYQDGTFTINGSHFGSPQGAGNVSVNGANQDGTMTWGVSSISAVGIPNTGADSGSVTVTRDGGKTSNEWSTFYIYPQITGYTNTTDGGLTDGGRQTHVITVNGNHFGSTQGSGYVTINGQTHEGTATWGVSSISNVGIPDSGTNTGVVKVRRDDTKESNDSSSFTIYPDVASLTVPTVFSDAARKYDGGDSDGVITINGTHLGAAGSVTIIDSSATQQTTGTCSGSAYQATCVGVQIPTAIGDTVYTGDIVLTRTSDSKTDTYAGFYVLPRISTNNPASGLVGDTIQITGDHFCESACPSAGSSTSSDNVKFGSTQALAGDFVDNTDTGCSGSGSTRAWAHTQICVKVPSGTPQGSNPTQITTNSYTSNTKAFTRSSTVPNDPTSPEQYRSNGTTTISLTGITNETTVVLKMSMSSPANATLVPQVEVKAIGTAFDGTTNITEGSGVGYTNPPGTPVTGSVTVPSLVNLTEYHWRARVKNQSTSETGNWVSYGGNTENPPTNPADRDFKIDTSAPTISAVSAGTPGDITATITWTTAIASNSSVTYGSGANGCITGQGSPSTASDGASVTSHSITLNALSPSTTYYYRVKSTDAASNTAYDPATVSQQSDCRQFASAAPIKRLIKTTDFFIVQDTTTSVPNWTGGSAKSYDIFVSEYDATNSRAVTLKSAYVEISGVAVASSAFSIRVKVNGQTAVTYNLPSTGGNPMHFSVIHDATSGISNSNFDYPGYSDATNSLEIDFPSAPTSVSLLRAQQSITYHYTP